MIELTEYDIKLMSWSIQTSMNALQVEVEQDTPAVSDESAALLIRRLHKLEQRLLDHYEQEFSDASSTERSTEDS